MSIDHTSLIGWNVLLEVWTVVFSAKLQNLTESLSVPHFLDLWFLQPSYVCWQTRYKQSGHIHIYIQQHYDLQCLGKQLVGRVFYCIGWQTLFVSWFGLEVRCQAGKQRDLVQICFVSPSEVVVCGPCLVTLSLTINEALKWLSLLPILMQESLWWWQCSDRYIISLFPHLHTCFPSFSPSLISLRDSVDVKHHVYLLKLCLRENCSLTDLQDTWIYSFCDIFFFPWVRCWL